VRVFEAQDHTPTAGILEHGVYIYTSYIFNSILEIEGNTFSAINGRGIYFKGACNTIQRNKFQNCNSASNSYSDIQTQTVMHNNKIVDNLGTINAGSRTKIQ
jgi:hypothetical protein